MTLHRIRFLSPWMLILLLVLMSGCSISNRGPRFTHYFVPPAPQPAAPAYVVEEPPKLRLYSNERPMEWANARPAPQRAIEVQLRLSRAQDLYETGSAIFLAGHHAGGREHFDRALELLATAPPALPQRERLAAAYDQIVESIHRLEVEAAAHSDSSPEPVFDRSPLEDIVELTFPAEPGLKGKVFEQLKATVSQLPLEVSDPVLRYINYFSSRRGKQRIEAGLRRSGRYAHMIRRILDEEGLPQELIFLAQAESAFLPRAVSRMRATGMWQFMKSRGQEYQLFQTPLTDDRMDPEKATRAAARHLRDLYQQFGDWYLAVAAYNCGPYNVERAIQRTGYADFWELYNRNVLPRETANYLPIILAMTIMSKNPKDYGLEDLVSDPPLDYDTIDLGASTHLALLADLSGASLQSIRELNPAVLKLVAPAGYPVHVPKGTAGTVLAALHTIPAERRASWRIHRVHSAENVAQIARQYNTTAKSIADANGGEAGGLQPQEGDVLLIPVSYPGSQAPKATSPRGASKKRPSRTSSKPAPKAVSRSRQESPSLRAAVGRPATPGPPRRLAAAR